GGAAGGASGRPPYSPPRGLGGSREPTNMVPATARQGGSPGVGLPASCALTTAIAAVRLTQLVDPASALAGTRCPIVRHNRAVSSRSVPTSQSGSPRVHATRT